jgi:hypothetical protein
MTLRLARLAEILDRPQAAQRGIEKCQQVREEHVVQEQFSVAVSVFFISQCLHVPRQFAYQPAPFHFLRPQGQGLLFHCRPPLLPSPIRRTDCGPLCVRAFPHERLSCRKPARAQVKIW